MKDGKKYQDRLKAVVVGIPFDLNETELVLERIDDGPIDFDREFDDLRAGLDESPWLDREEVYETIFRATVCLYTRLNRIQGQQATLAECFRTAKIWFSG